MRAALVLALIGSAALAQGRATDRACDVTSRRSSRGGVACAASAASDGGTPCVPVTGAPMVSADYTPIVNLATITLTDNDGADPGCGTAALRLQADAVDANKYAVIKPTVTLLSAVANNSCGIWVKGRGGTSGNFYMDFYDTANGHSCQECSFVGTGYTLCKYENRPSGAGPIGPYVGNGGALCAGTPVNAAIDVDTFGLRCNTGATLNP